MIKPMEIEEIAEAVDILEAFDKSLPSVERIDSFQEGIQILNQFLVDNPNTPYVTFINNKKVAHTRRLLQFLTLIDSSDMVSWLKVTIALFEAKDEMEKLAESCPELKADYDKFINEWKGTPELQRVVEKFIKKQK
jgi:hypothetical protein